MEIWERELLVARIISNTVRCKVNGNTFVIRRPTREDEYAACEVYADYLEQSTACGLLSDNELLQFLYERNLWDDKRQKSLEGIPKDIEQFKVGLFQATFNHSEQLVIRKALRLARVTLYALVGRRQSYNYLSCSGAASIAKAKYLVGRSLYTLDGRPVFGSGDDFWNGSNPVLDSVMTWYSNNRIGESAYRELARNDPWRTTWATRKMEAGIFGVATADYSEEQRALATWSLIYDNAFQSEDCPSDEVVDDDDLFDGWMIVQRRKRDEQTKGQTGENVIQNSKVRNSAEVFVPVANKEAAKQVNDLNDEVGKRTLASRMAKLKQDGQVNEMDMPDTRREYRMACARKFSQDLQAR